MFSDDADSPPEPTFDEKTMEYMVWQIEECPTTGKWHAQGYVELKRDYKTTARKAAGMIGLRFAEKGGKGNGSWIGKRKGTRDEARNYCMKEESRARLLDEDGRKISSGPFEFGKWKEGGAGRRTDLSILDECLKECRSIEEVKEIAPGLIGRYANGIKTFFSIGNKGPKKVFSFPKTTIYWGPTGTGKSARALTGRPIEEIYIKRGGTGKWWDGYTGQDRVVLEEFDPEEWSVNDLLAIMDQYPCSMQTKGGMTHLNFEELIITCHSNPLSWWPDRWPEIERRIKGGKGSVIFTGEETPAEREDPCYSIIDLFTD